MTCLDRLPTLLLFFLPLFALCFPVLAKSEVPETPEEIRDTWGSVLYCQGIYQEPAVSSRIYPADTAACGQADELMHRIIQSYSPIDQQVLEREALQKAQVIRFNTRDVQEAVRACREQCSMLANEDIPQSRQGNTSN